MITIRPARIEDAPGIAKVHIWVFAQNPSRRFYEALGGQYLKSAQFEIGGATLEEVAYGWEDVSVLVQE